MYVTIQGEMYKYAGLTDLELTTLVSLFGNQSPPDQTTPEYQNWLSGFIQRYADYSNQRILAYILLAGFEDIPESIVKYRVTRLQDGTEVCSPGKDLRVKLTAKEFMELMECLSPALAEISIKEEEIRQGNPFNKQPPMKPVSSSVNPSVNPSANPSVNPLGNAQGSPVQNVVSDGVVSASEGIVAGDNGITPTYTYTPTPEEIDAAKRILLQAKQQDPLAKLLG